MFRPYFGKSKMMQEKKQLGFTLVELVISVFIASLLMISIVILIKSYKNMSDDVKTEVISEGDVISFIDIFTEEVASSGSQPIDTLIPSIYLSGPVIKTIYTNGTDVSQIDITTDLNPLTRQTVSYKVVNFPRFSENPNEKAIFKTKSLSNGLITDQTYANELVLPNVSSFKCTDSINPLPVNANANIRALNCSLVITGAKLVSKTYSFYAKAENQF